MWPRGKTSRRGDRGEDVTESNPETAPDSNDPTGLCPRCGRTSNYDALGSLPLTFGGGYSIDSDGRGKLDVLDRVTTMRCSGCRQATAVVEEQWIGDHPARDGIGSGGTVTYRGIFWWPPPSSADLDKAIPSELRQGYGEGMRALAAQAPRAAAVMLRRTVEALVRDRGSEAAQKALEVNLAKGLRVMADEHTLDPNLAAWAHEIRLVGNVAAHFDPIEDVTLPEATDLAKLTRQLMHYVYELPASIQRKRESRVSS